MKYLINLDTTSLPQEYHEPVQRYLEFIISFDELATEVSDGIERQNRVTAQFKAREILAALLEARGAVVKVADILPH